MSMSVAVIGVQIETNKLYNITRSQNCSHEVSDHHKFCPECGKKAWTQIKTNIDLYKSHLFAGDFNVVINKDYPNAAYIGLSCPTQYGQPDQFRSFGENPGDFLNFLKKKLANVLTPLGMWDEKLFGLWCVNIG